MTDNCQSYNAQIGEIPEVVLQRPDWMPDGERVNGVPVDACLAKVIKHLWANGIVTMGCCCGHGGQVDKYPNIVLGEGVKDPIGVLGLIREVDDRIFRLLQWRLVDVTSG